MYLDAGTNNETYLRDPLYVGLRQHRPSSEELYALVDEFVDAVQEVFPNCCIHFEDWTGVDAVALLARYRNKVSCYNDDIQGTAGVTLAGLINALKISGGQLKDQRILFLGSGSAAIGLADLIVSALGQQGIAPEKARQQIRMFDTQGLVVAGRPGLAPHKLPYAHKLPPSKPFDHLALRTEYPQIVAAIEDFKPTVLIGVSTVGKLFSREVVEAMSRLNAQPSSLPFPTRSINTNVCRSMPTPGPGVRRSTPAACNSHRFTSTDRRSCLRRPTTCISSPPSAWLSTPRTRSARPMKCSSRPHMPSPTR